MEAKKKEIVRTTIDLPAGLNRKLLDAAEKAKRSRHAQMIYALEKFFEPESGNGKKKEAR